MNIIIPIVFFFITTADLQINQSPPDTSVYTIYLVKQKWHTGIVLKNSEVDTIILPEISKFNEYTYTDIGWGDEEFYQYPGFDLGLAIKALFYPTPSVLRLEGFNLAIENYVTYSDLAASIQLNKNQFDDLCRYISLTFIRNNVNKSKIVNSKVDGKIVFYAAEGEYIFYNTCNTWAAKVFRFAGLNIKEDIILAEQLFTEAAKVGKIIKAPKKQ